MFFSSRKYLLFLFFLVPSNLYAFDDLSSKWTLDFLYHYARTERATLLTSDNVLSRQGAMIQFEREEAIDLFWRWYIGGDITFARYEASASVTVTPADRMPWQLYMGTGWQFGARKNFELFLGAGGSSEFYLRAESPTRYSFEQTASLRAHAGFYWRFLSLIGSSAVFSLKYSSPLTKVEHGTTGEVKYAGIFDATLRLRPYYDSTFSFYAGGRIEDYKTTTGSITYFTSRIYAGLGLHF